MTEGPGRYSSIKERDLYTLAASRLREHRALRSDPLTADYTKAFSWYIRRHARSSKTPSKLLLKACAYARQQTNTFSPEPGSDEVHGIEKAVLEALEDCKEIEELKVTNAVGQALHVQRLATDASNQDGS